VRTNSLISRATSALRPIGSLDGVAAGRVVGWAVGPGELKVEAWLEGKCVARVAPGQRRDDVAVAHPARPGALTSGFSLDLPAASLKGDALSEIRIVARPSAPWLPSATLGTVKLAGPVLQAALSEVAPTNIPSPFPRAVTDLIAARWPEDCSDLSSRAGQVRFVKRLKQLLATPSVNSLPALADYARYLSVTLAHCRFVERHFPTDNPRAAAGAADFHCKPNSVRELFPIIHQLFVLRSNGVAGDFAEFGCFKGYSSSMLSFACQQIGVTMHIFDSFEGLPSAEGSGYKPGQYAGSLEEVRDNVSRFGAVANVEFHKGFFADTFRDWLPPPLMCLWMDVDLEVSARDLMAAAHRLDSRGTLFSHECPASIFRDDAIVSPAAPDNPVAPMLARFDQLSRPLTGRYVSGFTGAFWPRHGGIPVIDTELLFDLVSGL
jgi:O-methyltransferase